MDLRDEVGVYSDGNGDIVLQQLVRIHVNEDFKRGKGQGLRCVTHRMRRRSPTPAEAACAFPGESNLREFALDDSPCDDTHGKTPYSSWPIRFSTSRAPNSVPA